MLQRWLERSIKKHQKKNVKKKQETGCLRRRSVLQDDALPNTIVVTNVLAKRQCMAHNCGHLELSSQWWSTRLTRLTFLASTALIKSFWLSAFSGSVWFFGVVAIQHSGYKCTMAKKKNKNCKFKPWLFANSSFQITWVYSYILLSIHVFHTKT